MIRYYGYYSNVSRGKRKKQNRDSQIPCILEPDGSSKQYLKNWAGFIRLKKGLLIATNTHSCLYSTSSIFITPLFCCVETCYGGIGPDEVDSNGFKMTSNKTDNPDTLEISEPVKSRSQIKREMKSLQKIGERLVELAHDQIKTMDMPDQLREAVLLAKNTKAHGARKRQIQFIGSLMRKIDVAPINDALHEIDRGRSVRDAEFHMIETWRDDLINGKDAPIEEILEEYPGADRQRLRQLVRNARKELHEKKPPHSSRALFRYIKKLAETDNG